jgi:hypothetical protein
MSGGPVDVWMGDVVCFVFPAPLAAEKTNHSAVERERVGELHPDSF